MNKIITAFLLTGDKYIPELDLNSQDLLTVPVDHLLSIVKDQKILRKR